MKINNRWIRDLFRYGVAILYSVTIIPYMVWSFLATLFMHPIGEYNKNSLSESMAEYVWTKENLEDYENIHETKLSDSGKGKPTDIILAMAQEARNFINGYYEKQDQDDYDDSYQDNIDCTDGDITDQFLQNEEALDVIESNNENVWENPFDIEKIISDLHLHKEKRVAVVAANLGIDWENEKLNYARLAWIQWEYNWSLEQNQKIRDYLINNAEWIYKDKHWWNEWDNLPLVAKVNEVKKMNKEEITWQVTYNDVTLKVSAPAESFPEWTILKIKTLEDDDSMTTFDITFKEVILMTQVNNVEYDAPMASFDISFYDPNDTEFINELQPAEWKSVSVTFDYANNKDFKNPEDEWFLAIYHMEDNDDISVANLVSVKDSEEISENTKSDSMSIYANTLSVYILTIVSDLDDEVSENDDTITIDAGYGGFIVPDENIVLSSTWMDIDSTYTWKILSKDNTITLPEVNVTSWHNFWWWYNKNTFLWNPWTILKLWEFNNSDSEQSDSDIENNNANYEIYACLYSEWLTWNICSLDENIGSNLNTLESSVEKEVDSPNAEAYIPSEEEIEKYGQKLFDAYNRAVNEWITTIDDISKVNFNKKITRAELAKMMVEFTSWVLGKEPVVTDKVDYSDVDPQKLWDLAWYIQLAYQYQIMWINQDWSPIENFNPSKTVTRAEFATVLSRVLYGDTYNQTWRYYYEKHIDALKNANILSNTDHTLIESRWWIMTMLYNTQL